MEREVRRHPTKKEVVLERREPRAPEGTEVVTIEYFQCSDGHTHQLEEDSGGPTERTADGTMRRKCPRLASTPWTDIEVFRYARPIKDETAASVHRALETGDAAGLRRYGEAQRGLLHRLIGL